MYKFIYNETVKWSTGISSAYVIISLSLDIFLILGGIRFDSKLTQLDLTRFDDRIVLDFLGFRFDSTKLDLTQLPVGTQRWFNVLSTLKRRWNQFKCWLNAESTSINVNADVARINSIWFKLTLLGSNQLFGSTWFDFVQFGTHLDLERLHLV